jgi:hypothetical protein
VGQPSYTLCGPHRYRERRCFPNTGVGAPHVERVWRRRRRFFFGWAGPAPRLRGCLLDRVFAMSPGWGARTEGGRFERLAAEARDHDLLDRYHFRFIDCASKTRVERAEFARLQQDVKELSEHVMELQGAEQRRLLKEINASKKDGEGPSTIPPFKILRKVDCLLLGLDHRPTGRQAMRGQIFC